MNIPELHLPTENKEFIRNPYEKMGEFRESTPVFWDEINDLFFFTRYQDVRSIQSTKSFGTTFNHIDGFEDQLEINKYQSLQLLIKDLINLDRMKIFGNLKSFRF